VICGQVGNVRGPVQDVMIELEYLDVTLPPHRVFIHPTPEDHTVFAYVHAGSGRFDERSNDELGNKSLVLFEQGEQVVITAGDEELCFLLVGDKPLGEPVAWGGPIVMNTQEVLQHAFEEFRNGTFIKHD